MKLPPPGSEKILKNDMPYVLGDTVISMLREFSPSLRAAAIPAAMA